MVDIKPYKLANIALRWMLREVINSDAGILFDEHKLTKFGVPGTKYAPAPEKISASPSSDSNDNDQGQGAKGEAIVAPKNAEGGVPQLPSVGEGPDQQAASERAAREDAPTGPDSNTSNDGTMLDGQGQEIEVPWWYRDAIQPMRDELLHQPAWWLLEMMPFYVKRQDEHSNWKKHLR